jgi:hypothetical protein
MLTLPSDAARIGLLQTEMNLVPHSHMFVLEKVSNELASRGHEVVVSPECLRRTATSC